MADLRWAFSLFSSDCVLFVWRRHKNTINTLDKRKGWTAIKLLSLLVKTFIQDWIYVTFCFYLVVDQWWWWELILSRFLFLFLFVFLLCNTAPQDGAVLQSYGRSDLCPQGECQCCQCHVAQLMLKFWRKHWCLVWVYLFSYVLKLKVQHLSLAVHVIY